MKSSINIKSISCIFIVSVLNIKNLISGIDKFMNDWIEVSLNDPLCQINIIAFLFINYSLELS